jgi:hypothetical protein
MDKTRTTKSPLSKDTYAFTVKVRGVDWDTHHFVKDGKPGTMAFAKMDDKWVIGVFCAGRLGEQEVVRRLIEGAN